MSLLMRHEKHILIGEPFPNPPAEDGMVYLACVGSVPHPVTVYVHSAGGEIVHQSVHCLPTWGGTIDMNLSRLATGFYTLKVVCGNHSVVHALTVGHLKKENKWSLKNWLKR